ncbi:hybrid sensor histidine kinase/response regulator [Massilia pseudoviolaceinigra]|uniref:hybrid sensor histidine kinase/response regulator n=1 Tax=Massilia pseudoviolaceinigra TaxID=3057165 RepID=UPI002796DAA4|nr:PAS domain-containing sensor histidine kinase [Massilia sp. CCM 9206]MDQ1918946.1 PAS domain S-box protein [Massilia sp. CCM 9206]
MSQSYLEADRLKLFISKVTDYAIYMLSADGDVVSWNAGAELFKGYTPDEIIGKHFSTFYTAEDRARGVPIKALHLARTTGKFEDEGWRVRKDGSLFWASVVIDPIFGADDGLLGYTKITRDITEKRRTAEALHASEERFRLLVQSVTDYAIYMLSPAGLITNWNEGARRIKRLNFEDVKGSHFSRFYTEEDRHNGIPEKALSTAEREGRYETEGWRVRGDGTRFWAHVVIDPVFDSARQLIGFAKITRDITERREAALMLERTREALAQSQKLEAIGKLTGGIAHDFNNLLSVICSGIDLMRATSADTGQYRKIIDSMERAAQRGAALTGQLLAFARQQPLTFEVLDINQIIASFEAVLRRAVPNSASLVIKKGRVGKVQTDVSQLESALLNLVINARDAVGENGTISLETRHVFLEKNEVDQLPSGTYAVIIVSDNGAGMTPEVAARALEPFFTTKAVGKGTGLGLSQVYGLTQQSGGHLVIKSAPEQGTAISLYFPAQVAQHGMDAIAPGLDKALIVDDQPDVLDMTVAIFQSLGYDALAANSGEEAMDLLRQHADIKVLFTDVVMPDMDGVALAQAARKLVPQINILLTSGYMSGPLRERFGDALGQFDLIVKPYRLADVATRLRAVSG